MPYETAEQKIRIFFRKAAPSLLGKGDLWEEVVSRAGVKIISKVTNSNTEAYLLSESSLIVKDKGIVLATCGATRLLGTLEFLLASLPLENISQMLFSLFTHGRTLQAFPPFWADCKLLDDYVKKYNCRRNYFINGLFSGLAIEASFAGSHPILGYEICINNSGIELKGFLKNGSRSEIRSALIPPMILKGYVIDDYIFDPPGYSLNAISESRYVFMHISPEADSGIVTMEADSLSPEEKSILIEELKFLYRSNSIHIQSSGEIVTRSVQAYNPQGFFKEGQI